MSGKITINGQAIDSVTGASLFDCADQMGVQVPTSCHKQGKCKECIVEITDGMEFLSPRSAEESHLKNGFRLACRCRVVADNGDVRCHTMRRGQMRIERHAFQLPTMNRQADLQPAVRRV